MIRRKIMLIVDGVEYQIVMFGYIDAGRLLFEMVDVTKEDAESILTGAETIQYKNSDGWINDLSNMKFDSFMPDERTMVILS